ncbi:MAG: hypothetical protein RI580_08335 [Halothece sp. Uz-M2-17]|nr:hypothetical protein [Halothece sp. Uz-M2-17]
MKSQLIALLLASSIFPLSACATETQQPNESVTPETSNEDYSFPTEKSSDMSEEEMNKESDVTGETSPEMSDETSDYGEGSMTEESDVTGETSPEMSDDSDELEMSEDAAGELDDNEKEPSEETEDSSNQ